MAMSQSPLQRTFDLEERTLSFAKEVSSFLKQIPATISNLEYSKQLIRSSSSVGANYIEATNGLGRKDFIMHAKISRKEAVESRFWLRLIDVGQESTEQDRQKRIVQEALELIRIFSAIIRNVSEKASN